jgi:hypothetical protein
LLGAEPLSYHTRNQQKEQNFAREKKKEKDLFFLEN